MAICAYPSPAKVRLVSLDYVSASDDDLTAAWLIDPSDFEQDLLLRESIHELRAQLTERQLEVFERCMLGGMSTYTLAKEKQVDHKAIWKSLDQCCFSERMRKLFRKNEKNVLRFCNKKAKEKRRLQRVKKPM